MGAAILVIGSSSTGLPRVLDIALRGVPAARTGGPVFGLVHALLTGLLPLLLLPLVGWVVDRWGPRRLVWWGLVALAVGAVLYLGYQIGAVLFVSVTVVGVGSVFGTQLPIAAAVNNWFQRRKAMAMAVMMVPSVTASFVFDTLRTVVVIHPRAASLIVAGTVLMLALPLSRLVKDRPEDDGRHSDGVVAGVPGDGQPEQLQCTVRCDDALRSRSLHHRPVHQVPGAHPRIVVGQHPRLENVFRIHRLHAVVHQLAETPQNLPPSAHRPESR